MAGLRNFILFCLFFLNLKYVKPDSFTAEFVYDALSRTLDSVKHDVNVVKSDIKDIKLDIKNIGQKIETIEDKVSNVIKITEKKGEGLSKSVTSDKFERQAKSLHRMLAAEKTKLRKTTDRVRNTFSEFESNFRSQLSMTNISLVNSIENLRQTLTDHQNETDATLLTIRNETDVRMKEINNAVLEMSKDSLKKIHEVEETISEEVKADLESVKQEFSSRLHSEITTLTANLTVLEKKHEILGQILTDHQNETDATLLTIRNKTDDRLNEINNAVLKMSKDSLEKIHEVEETISEEVKADLESVKHEVSSRLHSEVTTLTAKLTVLEKKHGIKASFSVRYASRGSDGNLRFSSVVLNEGSHYDRTTGVFKCQYPGLYAFIADIIEGGSGNNYIYCEMKRNGSVLIYMISQQGKINGKHAVNGVGTATGAATVRLVKEDRVYVYCSSNTGTSLTLSSFTGFLVSTDP